jgi:hypothetical protein
MMPAGMDAQISRQDAAHLARVDPQVISMWAYQGWVDPATGERRKLEVVARDWRKRPFYRYGDVMDAEAATRTSRSGRPRRDREMPRAWAVLDLNSTGMRPA